MERVYLDWAASAPPLPIALEAATSVALSRYGNPSSRHREGREASAALAEARATLASAAGFQSKQLVLCSGGSEAASLPLLALLRKKQAGSIVVSAIEHDAVLEQAQGLTRLGWRLRLARPGADGRVNPDAVLGLVEPDTALVAVMHTNNETGAINPTRELAAALRSLPGKRPLFLCDTVQAFGKLPLGAAANGPDFITASAHKIGGPRGVGFLCAGAPFEALSRGGGQEGGLRPGTENCAGAAAFAAAAEHASRVMRESLDHARALEGRLLEGIRAIRGTLPVPLSRQPGMDAFSPYIVSLAFPGLPGETMVRALDDEGIAVGTGSACSSSKTERRVLDAMGVPRDVSFSTIRVSYGPAITASHIDRFLEIAAALYGRYKS